MIERDPGGDQCLPAAGGTVTVPAATYLIDSVKKVSLRSYMLLSMDPNATLQAQTNNASHATNLYAYQKTQVEVAGGRLTRDRYTHIDSTTSTDEWNHDMRGRRSC